jgi:hypothetical protein
VVSSPRPSRARTLSRPLLALAALSLATACGGANDPGVSVTNAQSDVIFSGASAKPSAATVPGTAEDAAAAAGGGVLAAPALPSFETPALGGFDNGNNSNNFQFPKNDDSSTTTRSDICPGPPIFASAPEAATTSVMGKPKPGFYFWQVLTQTDLGSNIKSTTRKYTNYEVKNVSETTTRPNPNGEPTSVFTFDLVTPVGKGNTITNTLQVKQNAQGANVGTGNVGNPRRVAEPDAGIAIKKEVERNNKGEVVAQFAPSTPVLILPLPVVGAAEFTGTGTDPSNGSQLTVNGQIKGPDRITGCSEFVQGVRVDATVTSRDVPGQLADTVSQVFTFETQRGGMWIGNVQTPTNGKITLLSIFGERPQAKPRSIPSEQRL